jgi:hypothetical protein
VERSYGQQKVAYTYYSCSSRKRKAKRTCPGVRVRTDRVEPVILDFIYSKLLSDDSIREVVEKLKGLKGTLAKEHGRERSRIEAELTRLKAKTAKLLDLYEDDKLDKSTLDERLGTLQEKKRGLEERFAALPVAPDASQFEVPGRLMREYRDGLRELLDGRSPVQTRNFLARFIQEIRIGETQAVIVGRLDKARCTSKCVAGASLGPGWLPASDSKQNSEGCWIDRFQTAGWFRKDFCTVPGCTRPFYGKAMCRRHYAQVTNGGGVVVGEQGRDLGTGQFGAFARA